MNKKDFTLKETQKAIKYIKDVFQTELSKELNLSRVSAPLFIRPETGLNDNLSGVELPVKFALRKYGIPVEIVQSLAKWKRNALKEYGFDLYEGIYTDMNAIRQDEYLDYIHSVYVDQWDWELPIKKEDRNLDFLKDVVNKIHNVFKVVENSLNEKYEGAFTKKMPDEIFFITAQELEDLYPNLSAKEREREITRKHKAVFLNAIGKELRSGIPHDGRSPDYDDWDLNGDILFWNPIAEDCMELSSMGIRVDEVSLLRQLELNDSMDRISMKYHQDILNKKLPYTVGGGIGQSRICMFFLEKQHIGEVQCSVWPNSVIRECEEKGIKLL